MNGSKALGYVVTALLGLLSFLGAALWWGQQDVYARLNQQAIVQSQLAGDLKAFLDRTTIIFQQSQQMHERLERQDHEIIDRMNRAGMKP